MKSDPSTRLPVHFREQVPGGSDPEDPRAGSRFQRPQGAPVAAPSAVM